MRARVRIWYGDPIEVGAAVADDEEDDVGREELMIEVMRAIARLAGRADYPVRLAGRHWRPTEEELEADMTASAARRKMR